MCVCVTDGARESGMFLPSQVKILLFDFLPHFSSDGFQMAIRNQFDAERRWRRTSGGRKKNVDTKRIGVRKSCLDLCVLS